MNDSMAQPQRRVATLDLPGWKAGLNHVAALMLSALFLSSGLWKLADAPAWAARLAQARVPESLALAGAIGIGIAETVGGVMLLAPRLRRWGAWICAALLLLFVVYFAINYSTLRGQDCSCFPWLKRVVGPGFFIGDGLMLVAAAMAGAWARRPHGVRDAALILGAVAVFAGVSYGVEAARQAGARAPESVVVDGRPYDLSRGRVFVFFFNPECTHCADSARALSRLRWNARVLATPVELPQFAGQFLAETGLRADVTRDFEKLRTPLGYNAYPYGVLLVDGRERASMTKFEGAEAEATLRRFGLVQ